MAAPRPYQKSGPPVRGPGRKGKGRKLAPPLATVEAPRVQGPKGGRAAPVVDPAQVTLLAQMNCSMEEIAAVCGCSKDFLEDHFREAIENGRLMYRASLKKFQFARAKAGSDSMLIHLGRCDLGQVVPVELPAGGGVNVGLQVILTGGPPGNLQPVEVKARALKAGDGD